MCTNLPNASFEHYIVYACIRSSHSSVDVLSDVSVLGPNTDCILFVASSQPIRVLARFCFACSLDTEVVPTPQKLLK